MFRKTISDALKLRRQDSNMRPPGYEPGELPTAPLRDINIVSPTIFFVSECKGIYFLANHQTKCQ